jgi:alpha-1,3-mannosyl-glycoprotein beta-1,2-N-acetylglucosaminyltransferase
MLSVELWKELSVKWPRSFWDDWLRKPANRRSRQCIRPEISRVLNFGRAGASNGEYFDEHIGRIKINSEIVSEISMKSSIIPLTPFKRLHIPVTILTNLF